MLFYTNNLLFYGTFFLKKEVKIKIRQLFLANYGICISEIPDEINDMWMLLRLIIAFDIFVQTKIILSLLIIISASILSPISSIATTLFNSFLVLQRMTIIFDKKSLSKFLTNK